MWWLVDALSRDHKSSQTLLLVQSLCKLGRQVGHAGNLRYISPVYSNIHLSWHQKLAWMPLITEHLLPCI